MNVSHVQDHNYVSMAKVVRMLLYGQCGTTGLMVYVYQKIQSLVAW